jgi:hypothetical protein
LYEEYDIDAPYTSCHRYRDPISVPNCNAGKLDERLVMGGRSIAEVLVKTYTRRTINKEEAAVDKKEAT